MANTPADLIEDVTEDGCRICRENKRDMLLEQYYMIHNKQCFGGSLPFVPVCWAKSITLPDGHRANAIYLPGDSLVKHRYIAIDDQLSGMFPLERLCLLHEMVHIKVGPDNGHGKNSSPNSGACLTRTSGKLWGALTARQRHQRSTKEQASGHRGWGTLLKTPVG